MLFWCPNYSCFVWWISAKYGSDNFLQSVEYQILITSGRKSKVRSKLFWLIRSRGILNAVVHWKPWWMPGRTMMSLRRRHAIALRRFRIFTAQIKQNQVRWVGEEAQGDCNLLIKPNLTLIFAEQKQTHLPASLQKNTEGYFRNFRYCLSPAKTIRDSSLHSRLSSVNSCSCSTFSM